jgi:hypothetical protein
MDFDANTKPPAFPGRGEYEKDVRSRREGCDAANPFGIALCRNGTIMKTKNLILLTLAALSALGAAQQGPPPRDLMLVKRVFFALRPNVATELKVTADERSRIVDAFGGALEVEGNSIRLTLTGGQDLAEMEQNAIKVLDAAQRKRLEEVWIQRLNGLAIADDAVAKKLDLTPDQKRQADKLVEEGGNAASDLMSGGGGPEVTKKFDEIRSTYGKRVLALLTAEQLKIYENLKGKPFADAKR